MAKKQPAKRARAEAAPADPNVERLREIVAIMEASSLTYLEYEDEDIEVRLSRTPPRASTGERLDAVDAPGAPPSSTAE